MQAHFHFLSLVIFCLLVYWLTYFLPVKDGDVSISSRISYQPVDGLHFFFQLNKSFGLEGQFECEREQLLITPEPPFFLFKWFINRNVNVPVIIIMNCNELWLEIRMDNTNNLSISCWNFLSTGWWVAIFCNSSLVGLRDSSNMNENNFFCLNGLSIVMLMSPLK